MNIKQSLREALNKTTAIYYRASSKFIGKAPKIEPAGYYEGIDDDDSPKYKYDTFWVSDTPEIAASKYIGGAVLGASSMFRIEKELKPNSVLYIYQINDNPDKDISHWSLQDFEYLQEVRYRHPVIGIYIGKVILDDKTTKLINMFYGFMALQDAQDPFDERWTSKEMDVIYKILENGEFQKMLTNIKPSK